MKLPKLLYVEWQDARGTSIGWSGLNDGYIPSLCLCRSIGFLIEETEELLYLAACVEGKDSLRTYGRDITIPKAGIVKRRTIKL